MCCAVWRVLTAVNGYSTILGTFHKVHGEYCACVCARVCVFMCDHVCVNVWVYLYVCSYVSVCDCVCVCPPYASIRAVHVWCTHLYLVLCHTLSTKLPWLSVVPLSFLSAICSVYATVHAKDKQYDLCCLREQITYGDLYYTVPQAHQTDVKDVIYCSVCF